MNAVIDFQSASVILDKFHCFPTIPSLAEGCAALAQRAEHPTDRYLPQIFGLLGIIEDIYNIAKKATSRKSDETSIAKVSHLQHRWRFLKQSLPPQAASFRKWASLLPVSRHIWKF